MMKKIFFIFSVLGLILYSINILLVSTSYAEPFAYITHLTSNNVEVIDTATNTVTATVPVGAGQFGVAVNPAGTRVYVTTSDIFGRVQVSVIDTASGSLFVNTVIATVPLLTGFNDFGGGVAVNPAGTRVYVAGQNTNTVSVIDTDSNSVIATVPVGATPDGVVVNPAGTRVYVTDGDGNVSVIDTDSSSPTVNTVIATVLGVGGGLRGVAVNPDGTRVYVADLVFSNVLVIDTASNTVIATVPVGLFPRGVAVTPDGTRVYVTNTGGGTVSVIDTASGSLFINTVIATVALPSVSSPSGLPASSSPIGVAVTPDGTRVYVANLGNDSSTPGTVSVIETTCNSVIGTATVPVENNPIAFGIFIRPGAALPPVVEPNHLRVTGMEVTQGIQDLANSVPLVSGRRTFVRVYVQSDGPDVEGVTATLSGAGFFTTIGGDVTVPLGSLVPVNPNGPRITVRPDPKRSTSNDSFLFELPWNWINFAALRLHAVVSAKPGPPPQSCPNDVLNAPLLEFKIPTTLKVLFVRLGYQTPSFPNVETSLSEQRQSESFISRTYPLSELLSTPDFPLFDEFLGATVDQSASLCKIFFPADEQNKCASFYIRSRLAALQASSGFMGDADAGYGLIPQVPNDPKGKFFTRGACCTNRIGAGASTATTTAAHEMGHRLGRMHPVAGAAFCGHDAVDPDYPYFLSFIAPPLSDPETGLAGFDGGDASLLVPMNQLPCLNNYDLMGYCGPRWISDYTYKALYTSLRALHSDIGEVTFGSGVVAGGPGPDVPQMGDWLMVFGDIAPDLATAALIQTQRVDRIVSIPPRTPGSHSIRLIGAGGVTLADYPFTPEAVDEGPGTGAPSLSFGHVVPFVPGTQEIQIVDTSTGSIVIGAKTVSPNPPAISNVALQGQPTGAITVEWTASDPDGDPLTFDIFLKRDGGNGSVSLQPLMLGLSGTSVQIDTSRFGGGIAQFRVVATDGVQSAFADSPPFTLANKPPRPRILTPGDGTTIYLGQLVNLEGEATDPQLQDGAIPDTTLKWTTPGRILGSGAKLSISDLPVGVNQVTLTATNNSLGLSGTASVTVIVKEVLDLPGPTLTAGPGQIGWHVAVGESQLQTAELDIGNSGSGNLEFTALSSAPWLTLSTATGTAPATLTLTADPQGFTDGMTEEAEVTLTAVGIPGQVITVPVTLFVGNTFVVGKTTPVVDQCPNDPDKTQPGACGCGVADTVAGTTCTTGLPGMCSAGVTVCAAGSVSCVQDYQPSSEVCDGRDNDCDGSIDNGIASTPTTCGIGECASTGTLSCVNGQITDSCTEGTPSAEICDGKDNDCNGQTDEGIASTPTTCGVGECASTGTLSCVNGQITDSCTEGTPSAEICDGKDNDCNGQTDEDAYVFASFQQPINADGSSIFKAGSTIPVKISLTDCRGQNISTAVVTIAVNKISNAVLGTEVEQLIDSSGSANTGNLFRYDATARQYIFNLSTKGYSKGTYKVYAKVNNGISYSVNFSLK
jgi:YVTN family beta-propeller protein